MARQARAGAAPAPGPRRCKHAAAARPRDGPGPSWQSPAGQRGAAHGLRARRFPRAEAPGSRGQRPHRRPRRWSRSGRRGSEKPGPARGVPGGRHPGPGPRHHIRGGPRARPSLRLGREARRAPATAWTCHCRWRPRCKRARPGVWQGQCRQARRLCRSLALREKDAPVRVSRPRWRSSWLRCSCRSKVFSPAELFA